MNMVKERFYFENAGHCTKCGHGFPPIREFAADYFETGSVTCANCGSNEDPWLFAIANWERGFALPWALTSIGVKYATETVLLKLRERREIDLVTLGVPPHGIVVYISLAPHFNGTEVVAVSDDLIRPAGATAKITLYGMSIEKGSHAKLCVTTLCYGWMEPEEDIIAASYLADAVEALSRYYIVWRADREAGARTRITDFLIRRVLLPAAAAVEIHLDRFLGVFIRHFSSASAAAQCLRNLTGPDKLEVILRFAVAWLHAPLISENILAAIKSLRAARNKAVHEGMGNVEASDIVLARGVSAAVFFLEYLNFLERKLMDSPPDTQPLLPTEVRLSPPAR
jgi:hypothetical protein